MTLQRKMKPNARRDELSDEFGFHPVIIEELAKLGAIRMDEQTDKENTLDRAFLQSLRVIWSDPENIAMHLAPLDRERRRKLVLSSGDFALDAWELHVLYTYLDEYANQYIYEPAPPVTITSDMLVSIQQIFGILPNRYVRKRVKQLQNTARMRIYRMMGRAVEPRTGGKHGC